MSFDGRTIIEERGSTAVFGPGAWIPVDGQLNLLAEPTETAGSR